MKEQKKAVAAAVAYAVIIGFSFLFVKLALEHAPPLDLLAHRFTLSFGLALAVAAFAKKRTKLTWRSAAALLPLSLFYPVLFFGLQTYGLVVISSSEAGIIQAGIPILTLLLAAYFLKERSTRIQRLCIVLSVSGVIYMFAMKGVQMSASDVGGSLLVLLSALASAIYSVMTRVKTKSYSAMDITFVMMGMGFVVFNGMAIWAHVAQGTLDQFFRPFAEPVFVLAIVYIGGVSSLLSSLLNNYALTHMPAFQMSVFINFSTLVTIAAGVLVLDERLELYHVIGATLVIGGVAGTNIAAYRQQQKTRSG